jgi:hypothetical protein
MVDLKLSAARLAEILRRQQTPSFGPTYEPSIRACREEAPSGSRFAEVWSCLLGRSVHTLSGPERAFLSVLLYCEFGLFELQEQRMLPYAPAAHPLEGHPQAAGLDLKRFRGTLKVADELHHLAFHPFVTLNKNGAISEGPGCWIGDYLAFFTDGQGAFCLNFNIKETRAEFTVPSYGVTVKTRLRQATARNTARHEVEKQLYADIGIRTIEVATEEIPEILAANLLELLRWQKHRHVLTPQQVQTVLNALNEGLDRGASPLEVMGAVELDQGIDMYDQKIVLMQGIFDREVRLDLFESHIFIDKPMTPEQQDVKEVFGHWFRREA